MVQWYGSSWSEIVKSLESNIYSGLDEDEIDIKREKYGTNKIIIPQTRSLHSIVVNQIKEPWMLILILSLGVFLYFNQFMLASMVLFIIILSVGFTSLDEHESEKSIKELESLNNGLARVVRDGRTLKVPFKELVVGDIVIVGKGEGVPADLRVIESEELKVSEISVTGEKFLVEKYETKIEDKEISLSDMKNILFKSSVVVNGSGTGIVIATGMDTQIANVVKIFFAQVDTSIPIGKRIHGIVNYFSLFSVAVVVLNVALKVGSKENINQIIFSSSEFISGTIPQGLIIIISIFYMFLFRKMKKNFIEFKDLSVLEKLSSVSVICTDKVGAFAKNKMEVAKIFTNGNFIEIVSDTVNSKSKEANSENLERIMRIGLLCNDTQMETGKVNNPKEDLTELAIVKFAMINGLDKRKSDKHNKRVSYIPFDNERKIMTTINSLEGNYRANIKGAVDSILNNSTHIMKNGVEVEITEEEINAIRDAGMSMSAECLSVVGFAYRNFNYEPSLKEDIESHLVFVGLVGFENKLKGEAIDSIGRSEKMGIKPVIITDDNKLTAFAVGKKLNLLSKLNEIISGVEIDNMSKDEFDRIGDKIKIFSKIRTRHKVKAIKALKSYGYITAITCAKLVDLPALRVSDVGITTSTSKMVRRLSDIILKDISFMHILDIIEDSRKIVNLLKKIVIYVAGCTSAMLTFSVLSLLWKYNLTLIYIEAFWFHNIVIFISCLALVVQHKNEKSYCNGYKIDKSILKENLVFTIFNGLLIGGGAFIPLILNYNGDTRLAQILSFTVLNLCAVLFTFSFSQKKIFQSKLSNLVLAINLFLQLGLLVIAGGLKVILNVEYWKTASIILIVYLIFSIFNKLNKEEYD
ncbi:cation-transporting P-type ATPase [Clostridiaceae bacterium UIB06]|uniref:Cation-transporting P-type ATPase n=1 Tax=Clostridium thailandense TaxID=2794346 RepID=A0A949TY61_9CLOT|nr:HAD-IC family P-type ATPase [Clostridium thailandense]MBV7273043.1 cation-transporting P-type ATPase [Clostridium thailandense]MCH5135707.1 cation-transporting P-type ATPase [Clostridiaceae bacterium UIB06]